jgi:pectate lyase
MDETRTSVGCTGKSERDGDIRSEGQLITLRSLCLKQLADGLGTQAIEQAATEEERNGTIDQLLREKMLNEQVLQRTALAAAAVMWTVGYVPAESESWTGWADTTGGTDGKVIRVTNLDSEGPGSLRGALNAKGKRLVVFDVGGVIDLQKETLEITEPHLTIAGQTAPSPGITIIKGGLIIRTHDVIVQHICVRAGDVGQGMDAMATGEGADNVLIDHCSLTWATDEKLSVSGPRIPGRISQRVTLSYNLVAEGLLPHSCGSLIHDFCRNITLVGNLYAHNGSRNPARWKAHTSGVVVNNVIYNPGSRKGVTMWLKYHAPEFRDSEFEPGPIYLSVVGNILFHGPSTRTAEWRYLDELPFMHGPDGFVYGKDNHAFDIEGAKAKVYGEGIKRLDEKPVWPDGLKALPADQVVGRITENVGARPWDRDEIDRRIIQSFKERKGGILESQEEVGGYPDHKKVIRILSSERESTEMA